MFPKVSRPAKPAQAASKKHRGMWKEWRPKVFPPQGPMILVGMPASGKSALGRFLSEALDCPFYDLDQVIEKELGISVAEIFRSYGEEFFRRKEEQTALALFQKDNCIVSLGGGTFENPHIRRHCQEEKLLVIWIKLPLYVLIRRARHSKTVRPLLEASDLPRRMEALYRRRRPHYQEARFLLMPRRFDTVRQTSLRLLKHIACKAPIKPPEGRDLSTSSRNPLGDA